MTLKKYTNGVNSAHLRSHKLTQMSASRRKEKYYSLIPNTHFCEIFLEYISVSADALNSRQ